MNNFPNRKLKKLTKGSEQSKALLRRPVLREKTRKIFVRRVQKLKFLRHEIFECPHHLEVNFYFEQTSNHSHHCNKYKIT